jgi:Icc-related predicted phosphoesterase
MPSSSSWCRWFLRSFATLSCALGCAAQPTPTFAGTPHYAPARHFTVIGDLQGTLGIEKLLRRETNDRERGMLLPEIARSNPAFVVMLGDLVTWGASVSDWKDFDTHSKTLRENRISVFAVPGNHDYYGGGRLHQYFARLPHLAGQHWYARRYGGLALVFLDSNAGPLSASAWLKQRQWYEAKLRELDADPGVLGVLVFLHHAPMTNSSIVSDDANVLEAFVPAFHEARKTMALVTGHAHGYEHFAQCGKAFIVTGGGGGPRSPLLTGNERRHRSEVFKGPALRNFNFVELSLTRSGLHADVIGLPKNGLEFCRMEKLDLAWPGGLANDTELSETAVSTHPNLRDCYK